MLSACDYPIAEKYGECSDFEEFKADDPFKHCDSIVSKDIILNISHEHYKESELGDKILVISLSGLGEIYRSDFKNNLELSNVEICRGEWYSIRFDLLDKPQNKHYWWSNLESYPLSQYSEIDVTLLSKRKHISEEEIISFEIELH